MISEPAAERDNAQLINQHSGEQEYFTAALIVEAARDVMRKISLDPASSALANESVRALLYFDKQANGLVQPWVAETVWMNHPFSAGWTACTDSCKRKTCDNIGHRYYDIPSNADWINKLVSEFKLGNFEQACCITYASTSEAWFQPLLRYPKCWLHPRTNYFLPDGSIMRGVTKGSVVTYLGLSVNRFAQKFSSLGQITVPYQ